MKYSFIGRVGMLFNVALHWFFMNGENRKQVILSFDLCKEECREIPQPNDVRYECIIDSVMAVIDDCLCIFRRHLRGNWVMKNYNGKQSWVLETDNDNNVAHYSETQKDYITPESFLAKFLKTGFKHLINIVFWLSTLRRITNMISFPISVFEVNDQFVHKDS